MPTTSGIEWAVGPWGLKFSHQPLNSGLRRGNEGTQDFGGFGGKLRHDVKCSYIPSRLQDSLVEKVLSPSAESGANAVACLLGPHLHLQDWHFCSVFRYIQMVVECGPVACCSQQLSVQIV